MQAQPSPEQYFWGSAHAGLRLGLLASPAEGAGAYPLELRLAARNDTNQPAQLEAAIALIAEADSHREQFGGGPRPSKPWLIAPGDVLEILSWRFDRPPMADVARHRFWAELREPAGAALRSGELEVNVAR